MTSEEKTPPMPHESPEEILANEGSPDLTSGALISAKEALPTKLFIIPVAQTSFFPGMIVPFVLPEGRLAKAADMASQGTGYIGIVDKRNGRPGPVGIGPTTALSGLARIEPEKPLNADPTVGDFHAYGVVGRILKKIHLPDNQVSILVTGLERFRIDKVLTRDPHAVAAVTYQREEYARTTETEAMLRSALVQFKTLSKDNPLISEEVKVALINIDGPGKLTDFMASVLIRDQSEYQRFLRLSRVKDRLELLLMLLKKETEVQTVQKKIQDEINRKVSDSQRDFYLNEQLRAIHKELGQEGSASSKLEKKYRLRLKGKRLSKEAKTRIDEEFEKLATLPDQSSEYSVAVNYLDWATSLPWGTRSDENYDLAQARARLDQDHYGLKEAKERILEALAVKKLKRTSKGAILCFVGPPGTGKTSLGKSIARALNRKFFRFSVGGMRDEAEIKGHRRTYVGAMPGKLIQGLKRVGTQNPVFLIDEIDKIGTHAHAGDPASALLELLDPEQNPEFLDHYLDIPFDCSEVFFITTANTTDTIPPALLDRMEIIELRGYTDLEKMDIARRFLIPKELKKNALTRKQLQIGTVALKQLVTHYAREAGVRSLEKQIARICRKVAYRVAQGRSQCVVVNSSATLQKYLGLPPFNPEQAMQVAENGLATGLAWTQFGGDVLFVESTSVEGKGGFVLTGSLGDVMKESANLAYTFVRHQAADLKLPKGYFDEHVLHLHVPAGAIPKDGPSAGVTMAASLYSMLAKRPINPEVAMTGEITLTGRVLPVGGIKEKLLAARRANIKKVLIPRLNEKDLQEIEPEIKGGLKFVKVSTVEESLKHLFR